MKRNICIAVAIFFLTGAIAYAGGEHGGGNMKDHSGKHELMPMVDEVHAAMKTYVDEQTQGTGTFNLKDPQTGKMREMVLIKIHDHVGKNNTKYFSCADFKDLTTGDMIDLDIDVIGTKGKLTVDEVTIHKVNGKERYNYDKNDNRIPVK